VNSDISTGAGALLPVSRHGRVEINPSILAADFCNLAKAVKDAERSGADLIHVDYMDGHYVHNFSFGLDVIPALKRCTYLPIEVHLEIENPENFIGDFAQAGADRIIACEDTCHDPSGTLEAIHRAGIAAGISLNPGQPVDVISGYVSQLDILLLLAVSPGFGGQVLTSSVFPRISAARRLLDVSGAAARLGVDGGVNTGNIWELVCAGADSLVVGTSVFQDGRVAHNIKTLRSLVDN